MRTVVKPALDRWVESDFVAKMNPYEILSGKTEMDPCKKTTGDISPTTTLSTCGLFDELDLLHETATADIQSFDQQCPVDDPEVLGILDQGLSKSDLATLSIESLLDFDESPPCMDNPFFEQFMDVDQLFPGLALMDLPALDIDAGASFQAITSDTCQSDVVTVVADDDENDCSGVASPFSEIIDVVSLGSDADLASPCSELSDVPSSPESILDVVSVQEDDYSSAGESLSVAQLCSGLELDVEDVDEQVTVLQTSDVLTLLTQDLTASSAAFSSDAVSDTVAANKASTAESNLTLDFDQLFSISSCLGLSDSLILPSVGVKSAGTETASDAAVKVETCHGRKRACSSTSSPSPAKKSKQVDFDNEDSDDQSSTISEGLDKQTVRRIKNNIASKHARASRRQKEKELFRQADALEKSNAELRKQLEELTEQTTSLRRVLVEKLSGGSCLV